jgi:hypothetical protein
MRAITLIPISKRAKQIVKQHGERWEVLQTLNKVLFSDKVGPWILVAPIDEQRVALTVKDSKEETTSRWIHEHFDENFKVAP